MKDILPGRGRRAGVLTLALALVTSVTGLAGLAGCGSGGGSTTSAAASTAGGAGAQSPAVQSPTAAAPATTPAGGTGASNGSGSQPTWCQPPQGPMEILLGKGTVFEITGDDKRCRFAATGGKRGVVDVSNLTAFDPTVTYEATRKGERAVRCNAPLVEPAGVGEQSWLNATCFAQTFTINLYAAKAGTIYEFIYTGDPSIPVTAAQASTELLQVAKVILH